MESIIIALIIFAMILAFGIGAQDETMSTVVGSGSLKLRWAVLIGASLGFVGVIFLSDSVSKTIGADLLGDDVVFDRYKIFSVLLGTAIWLLVASKASVPISTTHSVVGSVFGIAIVWSLKTEHLFLDSMNWTSMGRIALGWVISPILGYYISILIYKLFLHTFRDKYKGLLQVERYERIFRFLIIIASCINQISRGGNDSGNALGIIYGLINSGELEQGTLPFLVLGAAFAFSLGLILIGSKLIKRVGLTTGQLRPSEAITIVSSTALILFLATILGFPVSGGHVLVFSMIGVSKMKGEKPERKSFRDMIISWIITFPCAALFSGVVYAIVG